MFALWKQIILVSAWSCLAAAISITVSDQQTSMGVVGTNAIDGNNATFWHSLYKPTAAPLPHTATLDLGAVTSVRGFTYLPRQDVKAGLPLNGNIGQHDIQISSDNITWTTVVSKSVFPDTRDFKSDSFPEARARYVRIIAYTEAGNRGPWTSAAEFGVVTNPSVSVVSSSSSTSRSLSSSISSSVSVSSSTSGGVSSSSRSSSSMSSSTSSTQSTSSSSSSTSVPATSSPSSASSSSNTYSATGTAPTSSATIYSISVDSFQTGNEGPKAIDGIRTTIWHSKYKPDIVQLPHNAILDLGTAQQVTGFTYLPRQDVAAGKPLNGNIGQYKIETSTDSRTWTFATNGTFKDDATLKAITFPPASARYVRITALTEAGNRGPWTSAAEFGISVVGNLSTPGSPSRGKWGSVFQLGIVAAGAFIVPESGNVITFSRSGKINGGAGTGNTWTAIYNFATKAVSQRNVAETKHDMFCPGMSHDFNGRSILSGGQDAAVVSGYTPGSDSWSIMPEMNLLRGYQGQTTLSDGRTFIIGGSWLADPSDRGGKDAEIYDPATNKWTMLPGCPVGPMLTNDNNGIYRSDNHGWLFAWSNATIFQAGPSKNMHWYDANGDGAVTSVGTRASDNDAMCGVAVLYDAAAGKIFTTAGAPSYENAAASAAAHLITIGSPGSTPSVATLPSLHYARSFANAVVLPDGKVFVIGGQPYPVTFTDTNAIFQPEMWDPATQTFDLMPPHQIPRCYHSVALLLLDGTVFTAGGGLCGSCSVNHVDAEIYSPGYLFNSDGTAATRPVITSCPSTVGVGGSITVVTDSPVTRFSLIRYGSATHTVNTDQRRLAFDSGISGTSNTITIPGDPGVALPGYWMVFALNANGVPSVAKTIRVTA